MTLAQFVRDGYVYHWGVYWNPEAGGEYDTVFRCSEEWIVKGDSDLNKTPSLCGQWTDPKNSKNQIPGCWDPQAPCGANYDCPQFGTPYYFQCLLPYYASYSFANNSQDDVAALFPDGPCVQALNQLLQLCPCVLTAIPLEQIRKLKGGTFTKNESALIAFCYFLFSRLNRDVSWNKSSQKIEYSKVTAFTAKLYVGRPGANPYNPKLAEPWADADWQAVRDSLVAYGDYPSPKLPLVTDDDSFNDALQLFPVKQKSFMNHLHSILPTSQSAYDLYMQPMPVGAPSGGMCMKKCGSFMSRLDPSCAGQYPGYPTLPAAWAKVYAGYFPGTQCW